MKYKEILDQIIDNKNDKVVVSFGSSIKDKDEIQNISLLQILNLDKDRFSTEANAIIESFEKDKELPYQDLYEKLKWKIVCLINIQDVLPGVIYSNGNPDIMGTRNYFYYEGLHLLREYFYCGFNNYLSAAEHLQRTFVEFNIKQCYFDFICKEQNSFKPLTDYLSDVSRCPSSLKMTNKYLPNHEIAKPIKKRIQILLKALSEKSSHSYKPIDSIRRNGKLRHEYSMDTIMFWLSMNQTLTVILWNYFLTRPILFNPKDIVRRFGFSYPMGAFISEIQYSSVVNSISDEDLALFNKFAESQQEYKDLEEFYNSQKELTDSEIMQTWDEEEEIKTFEMGYLKTVVKLRAVMELLSSKCAFDSQIDIDESLEPLIYKISDYSWWKKNYKGIKSS